jgi:hypothetical protein
MQLAFLAAILLVIHREYPRLRERDKDVIAFHCLIAVFFLADLQGCLCVATSE